MKPLVPPQINLNGTSREALVEQQADVVTALATLLKAMSYAFPNGRDYQLVRCEMLRARRGRNACRRSRPCTGRSRRTR